MKVQIILSNGSKAYVPNQQEADWYVSEKGAKYANGSAKLNVGERIALIESAETIEALEELANGEEAKTALAAIEAMREKLG
jgi:hypothetical protein